LKDACAKTSRERIPLFDKPFFRQCRDADTSFVFYRREDNQGPFFLVAFYMPAGETKESVCKQLEDMVARTLGKDRSLYTRTYRSPWFEPSIIPADTPLAGYLAAALRSETQAEPVININGKQDSFAFRNHAKIPTVSFGVSGVAEGGFHQPNENVLVEEGWDGCRIAYRTVYNWMKGG
jgi:acetylornithine deacetylase/succinyl-diaminopimelate desuccinylase-like protein